MLWRQHVKAQTDVRMKVFLRVFLLRWMGCKSWWVSQWSQPQTVQTCS